ncbi:hypothetical protein CP533_6224 [Ophiocordyceps camponoti-saundersi (nom. inval.)]|nr:hypothetical protein CP533_6224 [Ophiocordyceps camponoti-saundersi (nom. inval.)]
MTTMTTTTCAEPHLYLVTCEAPPSGTSRCMGGVCIYIEYVHASACLCTAQNQCTARESSLARNRAPGLGFGRAEKQDLCLPAQSPVSRKLYRIRVALPTSQSRRAPLLVLPTAVQHPLLAKRMASIEPHERDLGRISGFW